MEGLGEHISRAVAAKLTSEFVEKEVDTRIGKLVTEAVNDALRIYSDTGKLITAAVAAALRVESLDLPSYGHIVTQMLRAQVDATVSELVAGRLAADMAEILSLAPKEVKLSEIAKYMLDEGNHGVEYGPAITVIVEPPSQYGSVFVYLDESEHHEDRRKYDCRHSLLVGSDGVIASATVDKRSLNDTQHIGRSYGIAQRLRAYVACKTRLILDEEFVVTGIGDY